MARSYVKLHDPFILERIEYKCILDVEGLSSQLPLVNCSRVRGGYQIEPILASTDVSKAQGIIQEDRSLKLFT